MRALFQDFEFNGAFKKNVTEINGVRLPDGMGLNGEEIKVLCSSFEEFMEKIGSGDYF